MSLAVLLVSVIVCKSSAVPSSSCSDSRSCEDEELHSVLQLRNNQAEVAHAHHESKTSRRTAPARKFWRQVSAAAEDTDHELVFVIEQKDEHRLHSAILDRSTPGSANFRQWMSRAEVSSLTQNTEGMEAVRAVLTQIGATVLKEVDHSFIRARATVSVWRKLLDNDFYVYSRIDSDGVKRIRSESYLLPSRLAGHVAGILRLLQLDESPTPRLSVGLPGGMTSFDLPHSPVRVPPKVPIGYPSKGSSRHGCSYPPCATFEGLEALMGGEVVTPDKLRAAYSMPPVAEPGSAEMKKRGNTTQLIFASLNQFWSPQDRKTFQKTFNLPLQTVDELSKGNHARSKRCKLDPDSCTEANLDVQYMNAMSPWSNITFYYMNLDDTKDFDEFIVELLDLDAMPHVISISYGMDEAGASQDSVHAFDMVMAKLGLQGGTILVSSGDDGAAGSTARGYGCAFTKEHGFQVSWPASSKYVTSVGATMGIGTGLPEVACSTKGTSPTYNALSNKPLITTGGGYSKKESVPSWQIGLPAAASGRGVPDVSLAGHAYAIVVGNRWLTVDGTSASSPAFAGMISVINAERKARGKSTVGFLNPSLYSTPHAFRDITEGDNKCAAVTMRGLHCCGGYDAGPGWDAVTGLGVPDFRMLFAEMIT